MQTLIAFQAKALLFHDNATLQSTFLLRLLQYFSCVLDFVSLLLVVSENCVTTTVSELIVNISETTDILLHSLVL